MRIELLYLDDCPEHEPLLARLRDLVAEHGIHALIEPVCIATDEQAQAQRFLGSPTLRIDGGDVEPGAEDRADYGLKCRLYRGGSSLTATPPDAWIVSALERKSVANGRPGVRLTP